MLVSVYPVLSQLTDSDVMVTPPPPPHYHLTTTSQPGNISNCLRIRWELAKTQISLFVIELILASPGRTGQLDIENNFSSFQPSGHLKLNEISIRSLRSCIKNYDNKMKPIIFNQLWNCCNFSWEH